MVGFALRPALGLDSRANRVEFVDPGPKLSAICSKAIKVFRRSLWPLLRSRLLRVSRASAEALLLIEAESGKVLFAENATYPWYPASLTKLMTAYVVLHAVKTQRLTLDSLLTGVAIRLGPEARENGTSSRLPGDRRQRAQDADGEIGE